jgi:broad specificity phosphatase PhoE
MKRASLFVRSATWVQAPQVATTRSASAQGWVSKSLYYTLPMAANSTPQWSRGCSSLRCNRTPPSETPVGFAGGVFILFIHLPHHPSPTQTKTHCFLQCYNNSTMRLILTRHGKTTQNESGIIMGRTPGELNELGRTQSQLLGKKLCRENIDIIYSSPSTRCRETLQILLEQCTTTPRVEFTDDLQERDFGQLTGKELNPSFFEVLENDSPESRALGIEPINLLLKRTAHCIETIKENCTGKTVLVVTHSNNIRAILMYLLNKTFMEVLDIAKVKNCAITEFNFTTEKGFELVALDDISHLG